MRKTYNHINEKNLIEILKTALKRERETNPSWKLYYDEVPEKEIRTSLQPVFSTDDVKNKEKTDLADLKDIIEKGWKTGRKHIMIEGIGGVGKTVSLLETVRDIEVPAIYIPLNYWSRKEKKNNLIQTYIADITLRDRQMFGLLKRIWKRDWKDKPSMLLVLDGINEMPQTNRDKIAGEINKMDVEYPGLQIIMASRYDFTPYISPDHCQRLKMQTLSRKEIEEYLSARDVDRPEAISRVWDIIDSPLMLVLYIKTEKQSMEDNGGLVEWKENVNAGNIIWNFLQSEIQRNQKKNGLAIASLCAVSAYIVAPYIAYQMLKENSFSLPQRQFYSYIQAACKWYTENKERERVPEYINKVILKSGKSDITPSDVTNMLENGMCLFYHLKDTIRLMHQHFRDCLAAIHLWNIAEVSDDDFPEEWGEPFDRYVMGFLTDLFEKKFWNKIWEMGKKEKFLPDFTAKMLQLYKMASGSDISQINFRGMDLSEISLTGYRISQESKRNFVNAVIGEQTVSGDGHTMDVVSVSWCEDGLHFMSASQDCTMRIWNSASGTSMLLPKIHDHYIRCAQYVQTDEKRMASAGDDKQIICWEYNEKRECWEHRSLGSLEDWAYGVAWSSDGQMVACGDRNGDLKVFDLYGKEFNFCRKHEKYVRKIAWSPEEKNIFATGSDDGIVCLWDIKNRKPIKQLESGGRQITGLDWLVNGQYLIISDTDCFRIVNIEKILLSEESVISLSKQNCLTEIVQQKKGITSIAVKAKGKEDYVAVFYNEAVELFYIHRNGENVVLNTIETSDLKDEIVNSAQWNTQCNTVICGCSNGALYSIHVTADEMDGDRIEIRKITEGCGRSVRCTRWSGDGRKIAAGYDDRRVRIWDFDSRRCVAVMEGHRDSIKSIAWSPDDNFLASGADDAYIRIWKAKDKGKSERVADVCVEEKAIGSGGINSILWSKKGKIICGSDDNNIYIWDRTGIAGERIRKLKKHTKRVYSLAFSPDEKYFVSVGNDRRLCLWNTDEERCVQDEESFHKEPIRGVSWLPDGRGVVTGSNDGTIIYRAFDSRKGQLSDEFEVLPKEHTDFIYSIMCTGNNRYVVSGSTDTNVGFWDINKKRLLALGTDHESFIWNISASPEINKKYYVASASSDGKIDIWDVTDITTAKIHPFAVLEVIPGINLVGGDFSGVKFQTERLKELIKTNGGSIEELTEAEYKEYNNEEDREKGNLKDSQKPQANKLKFDQYTEKGFSERLWQILWILQKNPDYYGKKENQINDRIRDDLEIAQYTVRDQTRQGVSETEKSAGEVDIQVYKDKIPWIILEGILLRHMDNKRLTEHIDKMIGNYNPNGYRYTYLLVYYMPDSKVEENFYFFKEFREKFMIFLEQYVFKREKLKILEKAEKDMTKSFYIIAELGEKEDAIRIHFCVLHIKNKDYGKEVN